MSIAIWCLGLIAGCTRPAIAGRVANGNDLALDFVSASPAARPGLAERAKGSLVFFRYLRVTDCTGIGTNGSGAVRMTTTEPASDMTVSFVVTQPVSLSLVREQGITNGTGIAVTGKVADMDADTRVIRLDPVIVRHRDRLSPAVGKELLHEIDPNARKGTDTSTGREVIQREDPVYKKP